MSDTMTIREIATRSDISASALRFYEREGLLDAGRSPGNQRRYPKALLRRIAFIRAAQSVGLTLSEIRVALATLPRNAAPTKQDWARLSSAWQPQLDARIRSLTALRDQLTQCIGCGCLSLKACKLYNPDDVLASGGGGARLLLKKMK